MITRFKSFTLCAIFALSFSQSISVFAQTTAFTYQGRLTDNGLPATGLYDLQFSLHDADSAGSTYGDPFTSANTPVTNGLFTVMLDFGASMFTGAARWLEIGVRPGGSGTNFTILALRQPITATPYALHAAGATTASSAASVPPGTITGAMLAPGAVSVLGSPNGLITNAIQVGTNGFVGIGTNQPQAGLQITTGTIIYAPNLQAQMRDESNGYTNLYSAWCIAASSNLVAVGSYFNEGLTLVDITTPSAPILRSQIRDGDGVFTNLYGIRGLAFNGTLLAVAANGDNTVTLISVTNPAAPVKLAELRDGVGAFNFLGGPNEVAFSTNNLLAIAAAMDNAVTLVDVSNPVAPSLRGYIQNGFNGFTNLQNPERMVFAGNLLIIAARNSSAVTIVDVSTPSNPQLRAVLQNGANGFSNLNSAADVAIAGNLLTIAALGDSAVTLVDVSNPVNPQLLSVLKNGVGGFNNMSGAWRLAFWTNNMLAISAWYGNGITLVDVSNPVKPVLKGEFRNGLSGVNYLVQPAGLAFVGNTLAVSAYGGSSLTLFRPSPVEVNLTAQDYVGIGTAMPQAPLHVVGNVIVEGASRMEVQAAHVSMGSGAQASGDNSVALGVNANASGPSSVALGWGTTASGNASTAMGESAIASAPYATAMGYHTLASGYSSTVMGYYSTASGNYATAMGGSTVAGGAASMAAGLQAKATNDGCFVWADYFGGDFASTAANQFLIRANGGVGINKNAPSTALDVNGTVTATAVTASSVTAGTLTATNALLKVFAANVLEFGYGVVGKDPSAGRIGYQTYSGNALDIVGAGSNNVSRRVRVYSEGGTTIIGGDNWNVTGTEGDLRIGSDAYRFKIGVAQGGSGAGDVWMRAHGGTGRVFMKSPGGATIYSNEGETTGVNLAAGGGAWTTLSDRNAKANFAPVDTREILEKVVALPLETWNYKSQDTTIRHLGPMAQDFKAAFQIGETNTGITTVDADGVALAAIQGLNQKLEEQKTQLKARDSRIEALEKTIAELQAAFSKLSGTK